MSTIRTTNVRNEASATNNLALDASGNVTIGNNLTVTGATTQTGVVVLPAGAVGAPSLTTTGDTNTGIYFPAADTIGFATNGAASMRLDASGNLGLGVTPSAWGSGIKAFQIGLYGLFSQASTSINFGCNYYSTGVNTVYTNSNFATLYQQAASAGSHRWFNAPSGTAGSNFTFTEVMTLDASGNLGVGTTSPNGRVHGRQDSAGGTTYTLIADNGAGGAGTNLAAVGFQNGGTQKASIRAAVYGNGYMAFHTDNDTEKARITSSGDLLVGTTNTSTGKVAINYTPSSQWQLDLAPTASGGDNYISLANGATYDLNVGSGIISVYTNDGYAAGVYLTAFGGSYVIVNAAGTSNTFNNANTVNIYYNAGADRYRIQNNTGSARNIYICTIRLRTQN